MTADEPPAPEPEPSEPPPEPDGGDEEVTREPIEISLTWSGAQDLDRYPMPGIPAGGGIYIVTKDGSPIYVGMAERFSSRFRGRLLNAYQIGLLAPQQSRNAANIKVYFGTMRSPTAARTRTAEHAVIRFLMHGMGLKNHTLRNQQSISDLVVGRKDSRPITIAHPAPGAVLKFVNPANLPKTARYDRATSVLTLPAGTSLEFTWS